MQEEEIGKVKEMIGEIDEGKINEIIMEEIKKKKNEN